MRALLFRGPTPEPDAEKSKELFRGLLANISRLHEEGKIILAGPMMDKTDLRGIFLFDLDSVEEALRTMKDHGVRRLPVIDGHDLVGMVSQADVARNLPEQSVGDLVEAISSAPANA